MVKMRYQVNSGQFYCILFKIILQYHVLVQHILDRKLFLIK